MRLANRESAGGPMADGAAFTKRCRISQCMGSSRDLHVTASAGRSDWLYRINRALRIGHRIKPHWRVPFAAPRVTHGAVASVAYRPGRAHRGVANVAEIIVTAAE